MSLLKFQASATLWKRDTNVAVFCECWKTFKNIYFEEQLWTAASKISRNFLRNYANFFQYSYFFYIYLWAAAFR